MKAAGTCSKLEYRFSLSQSASALRLKRPLCCPRWMLITIAATSTVQSRTHSFVPSCLWLESGRVLSPRNAENVIMDLTWVCVLVVFNAMLENSKWSTWVAWSYLHPGETSSFQPLLFCLLRSYLWTAFLWGTLGFWEVTCISCEVTRREGNCQEGVAWGHNNSYIFILGWM